jgi:hypothetical protein
MAQISGYFKAGKPTFANSPKVKALATKPPGYPVSGYFNAAGKPTFANSPQLKGATMSSAPPAAGSKAAGQKPGTSATTTGDQGPVGPPLDATAVNNIATNRFRVNNEVNSANQNIGNLRTGLQAALGQLAYQQPRDQLSEEQAANRSGSLYSTAYDQRLGDLTNNYKTRADTATTNEGQQEGALAAQIQALLGGVPLYNQGQANESVQRAIAAAAANPATGQSPSLTPEQVKYIDAGMAAPKAAGGPKVATRSNPIPQAPKGHPGRAANPFFGQGYVDKQGHWVSTNASRSTRPRIIDPFAKGKK